MQLHKELLMLRQKEKEIGAQIIHKFQLMENNRNYIALGYNSLFDCLVRGLGYSDSAAYQKQSCVRLCKEMPELKSKIDRGELTQRGLTLAYKAIKNKPTAQKREFLQQIENKTNREIKTLVSRQEIAPPVKMQKTEYADRVHLRLELTHEQYQKIKKLQALSSHSGNLENLFESLVEKGLKQYENTQHKTSTSKSKRFISTSLRNLLLKKANYRCQFKGCNSEHFLQIDHIIPIRAGGTSTADNLQVLCGVHNRWKG